MAEEYVRFVAEQASPSAIPIQAVERESAQDTELSQLRECQGELRPGSRYILRGGWSKIREMKTISKMTI